MDEKSNSQPPDALVDKVFGGCRLIKKIGQGGMGVVYLAHHLALNKNVAVKILPPSFAQEDERVKRFVREARSAAQLEHSNIIQIYNIAKHEDFYFIVMQYADGESLAHAIKRQGKIKVLEALDIVKDVASALSVAHKKNIIHRDIKPENIMINTNGEVKLMDFGLARVLDVTSNLSHTGDILGTPYYLSPEQAQGHKVDTRADIYSLGVTLYYMLSGKKPFEGDTTLAIILKHINEKPPLIRQSNPEIPECVSRLINKMLEKNPDKRCQSTDELIDDINLCHNAIVANDSNAKTITAQTIPAKAKSRKIASWKMIGLAAGTAFVIVVLLSALSKGRRPASQAKESASTSTEQISQLLKKDLAKRCDEFYKYLVNKDYAGIKPYLYTPNLTRMSEDESRQAAVRLLKRRYDFYEKRGNKLVEFRIKNIKPQEPTKDTPLVNAQVELDLIFHNTKQPPKHKSDYLTIPQTHTWLMENGIWYIYVLSKEQEDDDKTAEADASTNLTKKGLFENLAKSLALTDEQASQAKSIIVASQAEALNILTAPRGDGTNALSELAKLEDPSLTQEDKQAQLGKILSLRVPGAQDTYLARLTNIKLNMDIKLKRILSEEQFQKYKGKNLDIFNTNTK